MQNIRQSSSPLLSSAICGAFCRELPKDSDLFAEILCQEMQHQNPFERPTTSFTTMAYCLAVFVTGVTSSMFKKEYRKIAKLPLFPALAYHVPVKTYEISSHGSPMLAFAECLFASTMVASTYANDDAVDSVIKNSINITGAVFFDKIKGYLRLVNRVVEKYKEKFNEENPGVSPFKPLSSLLNQQPTRLRPTEVDRGRV